MPGGGEWRCGGDHGGAVGGVAFLDLGLSGALGGDHFGPKLAILGRLWRGFAIFGHVWRAQQQVHPRIKHPRGLEQWRLSVWVRQGERGGRQFEAVGHKRAVLVKQAQPHMLARANRHQHRAALGGAGAGQRVDGDFDFGFGPAETFGQQLFAVGIEIEH